MPIARVRPDVRRWLKIPPKEAGVEQQISAAKTHRLDWIWYTSLCTCQMAVQKIVTERTVRKWRGESPRRTLEITMLCQS